MNSLEPPSVLFARASKEFFVPPSARNAEDENEREKGKSEARGEGAPVRQLNFSSFGTQLEAPTAAIAPPCRAPATERDGPFPRPPSPSPLPYSRRVLRPLIPTFTRRTSAIANESRLAEPEPAATRFCAAPPVSLGPASPSFPPCYHVAISSCPSFFFLLLP